MSGLENDLPTLWTFFGAYLHQDWRDEFESTTAAIRAFLSDEPGAVAGVAGELNRLIYSDLDDAALNDLVREIGSSYLPSNHGVDARDWLRGLLDQCSE